MIIILYPMMDVATIHVLLNQAIIEAMNHHSVVRLVKMVSKSVMKTVMMAMVLTVMVALHHEQ